MNRVERPITQRREHTVRPEGEAVELLLKNCWIHTTKKVLDRWKKEGTVFSGIDLLTVCEIPSESGDSFFYIKTTNKDTPEMPPDEIIDQTNITAYFVQTASLRQQKEAYKQMAEGGYALHNMIPIQQNADGTWPQVEKNEVITVETEEEEPLAGQDLRDEIQRRFVPFDERATTQIQEVTDLDVEGEEPSQEEMDQAKQDVYEFYQERLKSNIESDSSARTVETDHDAGQSQVGGTSAQKPTSKPPKAGGTYASRPNSRPPQQGTVASRPNSKRPANRQKSA